MTESEMRVIEDSLTEIIKVCDARDWNSMYKWRIRKIARQTLEALKHGEVPQAAGSD